MIASRARSNANAVRTDSHKPAWTDSKPYGVAGERATRREVKSEECLESLSAILVEAGKNAGGRS